MLYYSLGLFFLTFLSTTFVGSDYYRWLFIEDPRIQTQLLEQTGFWKLIATGLYYSIPVMSILLAHELGHYLQCLRYGIPATPPLFIPLPIYPLGTMGAVILQSPNIPNRKVLFDIAISGPLGGLVIALPLMFYALSYAHFQYVAPGTDVFGDPPIFRLVAEWYHGPIPPGHEIIVDGIGVAVWVGLLVTGLNLIPIGQMDGGHILYCLVGKKSHDIALFLMIFIGAYMVLSYNFQFILMFALMLSIGIYHPPTRNDQVPLGRFRTTLGWGTLLFLFIGFTPNPIQQKEGPVFSEPAQEKILIQKSLNQTPSPKLILKST
jgi:membrane-associated protease RseP (regulator of RpoE activity)